jgi:hypothetical protein
MAELAPPSQREPGAKLRTTLRRTWPAAAPGRRAGPRAPRTSGPASAGTWLTRTTSTTAATPWAGIISATAAAASTTLSTSRPAGQQPLKPHPPLPTTPVPFIIHAHTPPPAATACCTVGRTARPTLPAPCPGRRLGDSGGGRKEESITGTPGAAFNPTGLSFTAAQAQPLSPPAQEHLLPGRRILPAAAPRRNGRAPRSGGLLGASLPAQAPSADQG